MGGFFVDRAKDLLLNERDDCMTEIMTLTGVEVALEGKTLFKADQLGIKTGEIVGIIGKNGSGKTTLLNLLSGRREFTGNLMSVLTLSEIVYVEQEVERYDSQTNNHYEKRALNKQWKAQEGFSQLSGGEKLKKRIREGLSQRSRLLLLDEPTNHLDEESVSQLIAELRRYRGAIVLVSHDRYFLDQIATSVWAIEEQEVTVYKGNYSAYVEQRDVARKKQQREFDKQQKEIKRVKKEMQQLANWSDTAHNQSTKKEGFKEYYRLAAKRMDSQRKSIQKRLEGELDKQRIERVKDDYRVQFQMDSSQIKKGPVYLVEGLQKDFSTGVLFKDGEFSIMFGDRVSLTGDNGAGKTTLLKILLGNESYQGKVWQSNFANIGYLSQEVYDLPNSLSISQFFDLDRNQLGVAMTLFVHLGFQIDQWNVAIADLSMGERVKIKLMSHIITQKNLLILDEPTNHLDIPAREELERVLSAYQGTLIFVSHDRYFREKVATRTLEISQQKIISVSEKVVEKEPDNLLLEFQRDELLSKLSVLPNGSREYIEANQAFEKVLKELKRN